MRFDCNCRITNIYKNKKKEVTLIKQSAEFKRLTVRFYEADLADKLNEEFKRSGSESMNALAIDLIKDGLEYRKTKEHRRQQLDELSGSFDARLTEIERQIAELGKTVYTQLNTICKEHALLLKTTSACCNLSEAFNFGETVTKEHLDSGFYDVPPIRFWRYE